MRSRFWTYKRGHWAGHLPHLGDTDEFGRRTLVLPIPFGPALVIAYRTCRCDLCREMRLQVVEHLRDHPEDFNSEYGDDDARTTAKIMLSVKPEPETIEVLRSAGMLGTMRPPYRGGKW